MRKLREKIKRKEMSKIPNAITAESVLSTVITSQVISGVLDEVVALVPIVIPTAIAFISIRKGLAFVLGMLRSA